MLEPHQSDIAHYSHFEKNAPCFVNSKLNLFFCFFIFQDLSTKIVFRKFQDHIKVDPGLAILPIIAILCGVAIGLGTVALGLILMIRGRHGAMSSDDRGDMSSDDDGNMKR